MKRSQHYRMNKDNTGTGSSFPSLFLRAATRWRWDGGNQNRSPIRKRHRRSSNGVARFDGWPGLGRSRDQSASFLFSFRRCFRSSARVFRATVSVAKDLLAMLFTTKSKRCRRGARSASLTLDRVSRSERHQRGPASGFLRSFTGFLLGFLWVTGSRMVLNALSTGFLPSFADSETCSSSAFTVDFWLKKQTCFFPRFTAKRNRK